MANSKMAAMKVMKAMKALLMTRHFDRSGRADQVASHLGPKSGMFLGTVLRITSKLCNLVCKIGKLGLILELAFWTLLAPLSLCLQYRFPGSELSLQYGMQ